MEIPRRLSKYAAVTVVAVAAFVGVSAAATARPMHLDDLGKLVTLGPPQISPDGKRVAYVQSVANLDKDRYEPSLMVASVDLDGGPPRTLVSSQQAIGSPRWSPNGRELAYLAKVGQDQQIFVVSTDGGTPRAVSRPFGKANQYSELYLIPAGPAKPRQVTRVKGGIEQFAWSPDGTQFAYVAEDRPDPKTIARGDDLFDVHDDGYLTDAKPQPSHIWLISSKGTNTRRLTGGSWSVLESAPPFVGRVSDPSFSPDGTRIVFTRQADADDSDSDETTVYAVDVKTGHLTKIGSHPKYEYQPAFASDSASVAYLSPKGPGPISVLNVFVVSGSSETNATASLDADVQDAAIVPRTGALLMLATQGAMNYLWLQPPGGQAQRLDLGDLSPTSFSIAKRGAIAFAASATNRPPEIYVIANATSAPKQITFANASFEHLTYGKSREFVWTGADGVTSDGVLTYPVGYESGKTYPLVLRIHGGPESATTLAFDPLRQLWAGRGYIVFQPNYRGSDNLGTAYEHAIYRDPGQGPGEDVMAGIAALEKLGIVDTSRIAVTGHSYGGYMTTWLVSHYNVWKAAVVGDGLIDWRAEYDLSGSGNLAWTRDSLGGTPSDPAAAEIYRTGSPITYASQITTPTLIICGTSDETTPIAEAYALYHSLHDRSVPTRFVAIPHAKHFPSDPAHIMGYYRVTMEWVDKYL